MDTHELTNSESEQTRRDLRHDLRTPVNAVLGLSQLLLEEIDGPLSSEQRVQIQLIQDAARSLAGLIDTRLAPVVPAQPTESR
jgi:adenylate cyclase